MVVLRCHVGVWWAHLNARSLLLCAVAWAIRSLPTVVGIRVLRMSCWDPRACPDAQSYQDRAPTHFGVRVS